MIVSHDCRVGTKRAAGEGGPDVSRASFIFL